MRFQGHVLHALGLVGLFVDEVRSGEPLGDAPQLGMELGHHVLPGPRDTGHRSVLLPVHQGRAGLQGLLR